MPRVLRILHTPLHLEERARMKENLVFTKAEIDGLCGKDNSLTPTLRKTVRGKIVRVGPPYKLKHLLIGIGLDADNTGNEEVRN